MNQSKPLSSASNQNSKLAPRDVSRVSFFGGGGGGGGEWNTLTPADLQTNAQSYSTFTLSASPVAGFENRIGIGNNAVGVFNQFNRDDVGVLFFDTGFSLNDLGPGDSSIAAFQISWEPNGVSNGSTYQTNVAYPLGVCLFSSLTKPPFGSVTRKGGYYGGGFLPTKSGANLILNDTLGRQIKTQPSSGIVGATYTFPTNADFESIRHTVTVSQGRTVASTPVKTMCMTDGDFVLFEDYTPLSASTALARTTQAFNNPGDGFTDDAADTVILGAMFNMFIDLGNGGVNPSPTLTWDFNLKWRRLFV